MSIESKRGRREEKRRKTLFITLKSLFSFLLFYNYSFASALQRRIGELKLAFPYRFKSLKMKEEILIKCLVIGDVRS
jgi:hypothetical protein